MDNMQDLLNYVLPWAEQNCEPVEDIIFRCFLHIENTAGLLSRYNALIASKGATPSDRQYVNSHLAQEIAQHLSLLNTGEERQLPPGQFLINSYSILRNN